MCRVTQQSHRPPDPGFGHRVKVKRPEMRFVDPAQHYSHFVVTSKSEEAVDNAGRWVQYMEAECIKLINSGDFVPRKSSVRKTDLPLYRSNSNSSVTLV